MVRHQRLFDVGVACAVHPVAKVSILEFIAEQCDDSVLGGAFRLAYVVHREPFFETQRLRGHRGWRGWVVRSGFAMVMDRRRVERSNEPQFLSPMQQRFPALKMISLFLCFFPHVGS